MGPQTQDPTDYPTAKIYTFYGMDRISSPMMLESDPNQIFFFPFIRTPLVKAINVIDDESGALNKRGGSIKYLDNPDGQPIQAMIQFTNSASGISQQLRVSGTHIYRYAYSGSSWGASIKTLTGNNIRMRHASLNGYLHLSNGTDPLRYYDGTSFYDVVNSSVTTTISSNVAIADTVINVASTTGFNPSAGYFTIGNEIVLYYGTTATSFIDCVRGYNSTIAATYTTNTSLGVYFGTPPTSPKIIYNIRGRLWAFNLNVTGGGSAFQVASARGRTTDSTDWIITANSTSVNGTATGSNDPASSQIYFLSPDDGQQITGVGFTKSAVIISKGQSTYVVQVDPNGNPATVSELSGQFGVLSHEAMVNMDGSIFSLNQYGIFATDSSKPVLMTYQIDDLLKGISASNLSRAVGVKHNFTLYMSVGSITEATRFGGLTYNNAVLAYNYLTSNWYMSIYPFTINAYSEMFDSSSTLQLYYGDTSGQCYEYSPTIFSDNSIDIPVTIETRYYFFREPTKTMDLRLTTVISENGENGSVEYSLVNNQKTDWKPLMKLPNFINTKQMNDNRDSDRQGRGVAYRITESSSGDFRFRAIEQEYEEVAF